MELLNLGSPLAGLPQRLLNVLSLATLRDEFPYVLAQVDAVLAVEQDPEVVDTQLWLTPLFGTLLCEGAARATPEEVNLDTAAMGAAAHAFGLFVLAMPLLVTLS